MSTGNVRKSFAFRAWELHFGVVTQPLALVYFQRQLSGNQLVNRLQDLNYRVQTVGSVEDLAVQAATTGVMLVLVDVEGAESELIQVITTLREGEATSHIPIIAFAGSQPALDSAQKAGSTMAMDPAVLLAHLPAVLDQALRVD